MVVKGAVSPDREPVVSLNVIGLRGDGIAIEAIVDTGFTDYLTLPKWVVREMQLPFMQTLHGGLADGSRTSFDVHTATVEWGASRRNIPIHACDGPCLLGMGLLYGHRLTLTAVDGGDVIIDVLS